MTAVKGYDDLSLWEHFRIATFMHAAYEKHGRKREPLRKTAMDCAGWYHTTVAAVVRVWHKTWPDDLYVDGKGKGERV